MFDTAIGPSGITGLRLQPLSGASFDFCDCDAPKLEQLYGSGTCLDFLGLQKLYEQSSLHELFSHKGPCVQIESILGVSYSVVTVLKALIIVSVNLGF